MITTEDMVGYIDKNPQLRKTYRGKVVAFKRCDDGTIAEFASGDNFLNALKAAKDALGSQEEYKKCQPNYWRFEKV